MDSRLDRRSFLAAAGASLASASLAQDAPPAVPRLTHGPFFTHLDGSTAGLWARASVPGEYELVAHSEKWKQRLTVKSVATEEGDLTLRWTVRGLAAAPYDVTISLGDVVVHRASEALTPRMPREGALLALGSCADERKFPAQPVWSRMLARRPDLVVMIGDTPYIDSTDLAVQRERYRAFYAQPELAELLRSIPFAGTWDDHDYAGNDLFGAVAGRENSRRAFLENHGDGEWGEGGQGIYTRRNLGTLDLFLLDTRWFADTEPSPFDATKKSLLGTAQWRWLQKGLQESQAPFKVLACGMIWNDATRPLKQDFWGRWAHERDGLFRWLGEKRIGGVVLVSGDIHRTRTVLHATKDLCGYDIPELITSPIATTVIEVNNAPHPGLLFDAGVEQSFLLLSTKLEAGSQTLHAEHVGGDGRRLHWLERYASNLTARWPGRARARWPARSARPSFTARR
jgi:alkaline phosphatase D